MTKWKKQIDAELGSEPKFHQGLQQKILGNSTTRKRRNFAYPLTLIGACFVALLLFITWSNETPPQQQASGKLALNNVAKEDSVQDVYVSNFSSDENKFLARPNTLALGMKKVNVDDMLDFTNMLRSARLTNGYDLNIYGVDVIVKFESGSEKKLRVENFASNVQLYDYETKLTYETDAHYSNLFQNRIGDWDNALLLFTVLLILSFHFVCVNVKERAPQSLGIYLQFIMLIIIVFILLSQNLVLSIWLPVGFLVVKVIVRYLRLRNENYDEERLIKMKRSTILLCIMWGAVFIQQLIGGL